MSFLASYFGIHGSQGETAVCCPFPHHVPGLDQVYYEHRPSAHVNLEKGTFHCKVCQQGHSEQTFLKSILECSYGDAARLTNLFSNDEDLAAWQAEELQPATKDRALSLGISAAVIEELQLRTGSNESIAFPALMHDHLIDVRQYNPGQTPKLRSRTGAPSGLIIPYDLWRTTNKQRLTLICAGEKDMAVARSHGFNAITITGGEGALPGCLAEFRDRKVAIVYDNDAAGLAGAVRLANYLRPYVLNLKVCTAFHEVCREDKEDITDFFVKYNKTRHDLIAYLEQTPEYIPQTVDSTAHYPILNLHEASRPANINRIVRSNIQVVAMSEASFVIPSVLVAEKKRLVGKDDAMYQGEIREWTLDESNVQSILHMMDNNFKEDLLESNYRDILRIRQKEKYVVIRKPVKETVYKCVVTDLYETMNQEVIPMEYTAYVLGTKLESGKKYMVTYKLVPHPYKGQQLTMLILHSTQANDSVANFRVTQPIQEALTLFQNTTPSEIAIRFRGILGYPGNPDLILTMDLCYHTPLGFNMGRFHHTRAYLDCIIVGESRMGKSSTAEAMRTTYELGTFTSLAGNAATIPGLIGGSNKTAGGAYQTRAGVIPQNHRGLIIFEELGKSNAAVVKELTDIRSSNEVRIARVSGTITLPAMVRMITLSNVKTSDGAIKSIASYPNGISILTELIGTAEDIARYDIALVLSDRGSETIDPLWEPEEPYPLEAYRARVRWVWSRTPEQIIIAEDVQRYIIERANELNQTYGCHIKIFGTEAWKKIARVAIAVAGYVVSTDETFEQLIVKQEHVDFAVDYLVRIYDNPTFKLKEYAEHERRYTTIDDEGVALLQDIYIKCPALLLQLEQCAGTTKNTLQAATGLGNEEYNSQINRLVMGLFITFSKYEIIPSERFRIGMGLINRNTRATRVGEPA